MVHCPLISAETPTGSTPSHFKAVTGLNNLVSKKLVQSLLEQFHKFLRCRIGGG
jgi:hypothetical protein